MNNSFILGILGKLLTAYALTMLIPLALSLYVNDGAAIGLAAASALTLASGLLCVWRGSTKTNRLKMREGCIIVLAAWILTWFYGTLPFVLTGAVSSYVDAFFETISGLTTTGATVIPDLNQMPASILLWRIFLHWLGGMGIIVLFVAVLPNLGVNAFNLLKSEMPGPVTEKIVPRIQDTAAALWRIYLFFTLAGTVLLTLAGMSLFDAVIHSMSTVSTGGFSSKNASIAHYDSMTIELIIILFMILGGGNFILYFHAWRRGFTQIFKNTEFKVYLSVIAAASFLVALNLIFSETMSPGRALVSSLFEVTSFITTTGFVVADYDTWPSFARMVLFFTMFMGACAGSTSGGVKLSRYIILAKISWAGLKKLLHPRVVTSVHLDNKPVDGSVLNSVLQFFFLYMFTFAIAALLIGFTANLEPFETLSLAAATLGNIGPGFGAVGAMSTYAALPDSTKIISSIMMLLGRLELTTLLIFLMPEFWRRQQNW